MPDKGKKPGGGRDRDHAPADRSGREGARRVVHFLDHFVNLIVLLIFLAMLAVGIYALWDDHMIYQNADGRQYETYEPHSNNSMSFRELQKINKEVVGWVRVYGTGINYPFAQGKNDEKYINTAINGKPDLTGAVFMHCENDRHFRDFNTILYGHHMEHHKMFSDLDRFSDKKFFRTHRYGDLYYDGRHHGLKIFAYMEVDAYDAAVYTIAPEGSASHRAYIKHIYSKSSLTRDLKFGPDDHIVLLSTCAAGGDTNERFVVAAKITDKTYKDRFKDEEKSLQGGPFWKNWPLWWWIAAAALILAFIAWICRRKRKRGKEADAQDAQSS